jgi:DNA-binding winged helix-turn-helix (wHTH) protein/class 3 adenylate cyclase
MIYAFGSYQLKTQTYELHCGGDLCRIDARAFRVLSYLIEHRDHTVSRDELLDNLWPDQSVSEGIITNCIMTARRAIGDSGGGQETIRTIYNAGYRFVAEVEELNPAAAMGEGVSFAQTPVFRDDEPDLNTVDDVSVTESLTASSRPQNVLEGDYLFVTVACAGLEPIEVQSETLEREVMPRLKRLFFAQAQEVVKQYEGGFRYFGSDGFLAIFGWPTLHEDHSQRAVRAGLELQETLRNRSLALHPEAPIEASVCIGLHTGPIELRNRCDPFATVPLTASETTLVAIRLQYLATSGIILTSLVTLPLLQESVEYVEHNSIYLPRHSGSTPTYRLVRLST